VDLAFALVTLRRAWWLLLFTAGLGLGGAVVVNATTPVEYTASVQQFVSMTDRVSVQAGGGALSGSQFTLQRVKSYTQVATSSQVLAPVITRLRLPTTVGDLTGRVQATNPLDTVLIELSVTDLDPQRAADTANAISIQLGKVVQTIEAPAGGGVSPVKVTVTRPATVPTTPVWPNVKLNLVLGLLVGLGLGAGGALLRAQLDTRITHVSDVEAITGRAPMGVVPFDTDAKNQPLISSDQATPRAEAFRTLRTNLRFADVDHPPKTLVITSALPDEGKSTSACNIALTLALNGSRVVLVEADLRKPRACDYLGLDSAVGLTNVLAGQHPLHDVLTRFRGGLLTVLPAGPIPPNPSELLGSQQLAATVRMLADVFDYVVIDAAPLLPVTDAAVLAAAADGTLVVVRYGRTTRDDLQNALQALESANARLLGTIVNCAPARKSDSRSGFGDGAYGSAAASRTPPRPAARRPRSFPPAPPRPLDVTLSPALAGERSRTGWPAAPCAASMGGAPATNSAPAPAHQPSGNRAAPTADGAHSPTTEQAASAHTSTSAPNALREQGVGQTPPLERRPDGSMVRPPADTFPPYVLDAGADSLSRDVLPAISDTPRTLDEPPAPARNG
jgi:capsular exopolysaccharide synthesis family protein